MLKKRVPVNVTAAVLWVVLLGIIPFTAACNLLPQEVEAAPPQQEAARTTPVEVTAVQQGDIALVLNYAGNLEAVKDVLLLPRVSGQIKQILVKEGDVVRAGDPVAIIEQDVYLAQLKQAESLLEAAQLKLQKMEDGARPEELAAARAAVDIARGALTDVKNPNDDVRTTAALDLAKAQAALRLAQAEYDKVAWAGQVGQTPQALTLEQATNSYEAALAAYNLRVNPTASSLASLEAQVIKTELDLTLAETPFLPVDYSMVKATIKQAEAAVELARLQLEYTTLTSPFDGLVAEVFVDEGSMVSSTIPVSRFVSSNIEVNVSVEESRLGQVYVGQHVALRVPAYPGVDFPAVVTNVAPVANAQTHTFKVQINPLDKEKRLHSGMFADVFLLAEEKINTLLVPIAAVIDVNGQPSVYVVKADSSIEQRAVTTGLTTDTQVEILSGLKEGDKVVTAGQSNLQDGARVEITVEL